MNDVIFNCHLYIELSGEIAGLSLWWKMELGKKGKEFESINYRYSF
jgi:hypothetical protein